MKAMILAAGEGSRLRPLTLTRPKPMVPMGDRPLLAHTITWLKRHGITEIGINLHYKPEVITDYFGDGSAHGVRLVYSHEREILGTAGGAKALEGFLDETFVVVYGDLLTALDLSAVAAAHRERQAQVTVVLYRVPNPWECGLVEMDDTGRITRFVEKPPRDQVFTDLANAGVYIMEPGVLARVPAGRFYDFGHDLFPQLLAEGVPMYGYPTEQYLLDIGSYEKYNQAQRDLAEGRVV
jgi:NDP-sugar pyrophosphorylase family protein